MRSISILVATQISVLVMIASASAQSATAIGDFYESYTQKTCSTGNCNVYFPQNTTGKLILVTDVMCRTTSKALVYAMEFGPAAAVNGGMIKRTFLEVSQYPARTASISYGAVYHATPQMLIGVDRYPLIYAYANPITGATYGDIVVQCSLGGRLLPS